MGRAINPRIQISREDMKALVEAGYNYATVRQWFFKESGPNHAQLPGIEQVLERDVEIIDPGSMPEAARETVIPGVELRGTGFCWVPFSAWEGFKKADVCDLCVKKHQTCRKAEAAA